MRMYRVVDCSDQQGAMIVYVVSLYDTYLGGLLVRLTLPLLFSSLVWCLVSWVLKMGITEVQQQYTVFIVV